MKQEVLRVERVSCQENDVLQLEDFSLCIFTGEIMGLLPLNTHGLSTFLRLLQHNTPLRFGHVYYRGEQVNSWRTVRHRGNRIGLIQSESCLVEGLTVADNIFVLRPGFKTWLIRPKVLERQLFPFLESIDIHISANAYVEELLPFERLVVDVLKSVVAGCRLTVLREISAGISETELEKVHRLLRYYAAQGFSFLYIDFHYEDLRQICGRVALMSGGRIIKIVEQAAEPDFLEHYTHTFSSKVREQMASHLHTAAETAPPVLEVNHLCAGGIRDLNFSVTGGECLVLQDVDSRIFDEFLPILMGDTRPDSGSLRLQGGVIDPSASREIAVIQELPSKTMLFPELSYLDNLCMTLDHRLPEVWRKASVREGIRREFAPLLGREVFDMRVDQLSERRKYELVYTRVAIQHPKVTFFVQPFRRADIELRMHIWDLLKMLLDRGIAVVILATNLADSLALADRLIRLQKGRPIETYQRSEFSTMQIGAPWVDLYRELPNPPKD